MAARRFKRVVIFGIDDLVSIFRDYLGPTYLPDDVKPTKFRFNPVDRTLEVVVESDDWAGDMGSMRVDFELKRIFAVS